MMQLTKTELLALFDTCHSWQILTSKGEPTGEILPRSRTTELLRVNAISMDNLALVDYRLPGLLLDHFSDLTATGTNRGFILQEKLTASYRFWHGDKLRIPAAAFCDLYPAEQHAGFVYVYTPSDLSFGVVDNRLRLNAFLHHLRASASGDLYVTDVKLASKICNVPWLDKHYPAWREQLATGESIGIDQSALVRQIFEQPQQYAGAVVLPNQGMLEP